VTLLAVLFGVVAAAGTPTVEPPEAAPPPLEESAEATEPVEDFSQTPAPELIRRAIHRIDTRDFEGARILASEAASRGPADAEHAAYVHALSWLMEGDSATALTELDTALASWPTGAFAAHTRFRRAEARALVGDFSGALRDLDELGPIDEFDATDQAKLSLWRGIWTIDSGDLATGTDLIRAALADAPDGVGFYKAKAAVWAAKAHIRYAEQTWPIDTTKRGKAKKAIKRRLGAIALADDAVLTAVRLKEPEWVLEGLLVLGSATEALGNAIHEAPIPKRNKDDAAYRERLRVQAEPLWTRAYAYYDEGANFGTRLGSESKRVDQLVESRDAVQARLEG
jgi:tetratricopeptide (TPR) repeat protein